MNPFKKIYCNQYAELKPQGKTHAVRANGTGLATVALMMYSLGLYFLIAAFFPDVVTDLLEDIFGRSTGRSLGRLIALLFAAAAYGWVRLTWHKEENYNQTIAAFEALDAETQKQVSKQGLWFFIASIAVFALALVLYLILS